MAKQGLGAVGDSALASHLAAMSAERYGRDAVDVELDLQGAAAVPPGVGFHQGQTDSPTHNALPRARLPLKTPALMPQPHHGRAKQQPSVSLVGAGAGRTLRLAEDMRNTPNVWTDPENAQYPLSELQDAYMLYLASRSKPVAQGTRERYQYDLQSFESSLVLHGEPLVLDCLNPFNVERWLLDMREGLVGRQDARRKSKGLNPETVSARLSSIKTFGRKYIYRHLELSNRDLLAKVERFEPPQRTKEGLSLAQLEQVLTCYDDSDDYIDIRDRAMVAIYAASGLRFQEVLNLDIERVDRYSGWIKTIGKGDKERLVRVGDRALKTLRAYVRVRRAKDGVTALFTTDRGGKLTYQGGQSIFRRLKKACGLPWIHSHRFRHTWAQGALRKGAERSVVQDAMGWTSDRMARRYEGWVRQETAAAAMPGLAPI